MDVGEWLRGLGLGQYEPNFRDNKISSDLLPRLTGDDIKEIGISALGDRLRLLDAIAALIRAKPPADITASPPPKTPEVSAERRPITDHVLRSCRIDKSRREARPRGLAQPSQCLSRWGFERRCRLWRSCAEPARRRADGPLRLSDSAGERCRARGQGSARYPAGAGRDQR